MLQHTLTAVEYAEIAGLSFVEWDAIFISDYFFENWYIPDFPYFLLTSSMRIY